ncbi:hypothetical protein ACMX9J_24445 [Priestia sp. RMT2NF4]|uniref:hypothetical protein n=1 Tax=Priestia sp. RMT2NF4 TaxID=3398394 RepID=UPI003A4C6272
MKPTEKNEGYQKKLKIMTRGAAVFFFLLAVYYIAWSFVREESFSSVIIYPIAISLIIISIEKLIFEKKSFIIYLIASVLLFGAGIIFI